MPATLSAIPSIGSSISINQQNTINTTLFIVSGVNEVLLAPETTPSGVTNQQATHAMTQDTRDLLPSLRKTTPSTVQQTKQVSNSITAKGTLETSVTAQKGIITSADNSGSVAEPKVGGLEFNYEQCAKNIRPTPHCAHLLSVNVMENLYQPQRIAEAIRFGDGYEQIAEATEAKYQALAEKAQFSEKKTKYEQAKNRWGKVKNTLTNLPLSPEQHDEKSLNACIQSARVTPKCARTVNRAFTSAIESQKQKAVKEYKFRSWNYVAAAQRGVSNTQGCEAAAKIAPQDQPSVECAERLKQYQRVAKNVNKIVSQQERLEYGVYYCIQHSKTFLECAERLHSLLEENLGDINALATINQAIMEQKDSYEYAALEQARLAETSEEKAYWVDVAYSMHRAKLYEGQATKFNTLMQFREGQILDPDYTINDRITYSLLSDYFTHQQQSRLPEGWELDMAAAQSAAEKSAEIIFDQSSGSLRLGEVEAFLFHYRDENFLRYSCLAFSSVDPHLLGDIEANAAIDVSRTSLISNDYNSPIPTSRVLAHAKKITEKVKEVTDNKSILSITGSKSASAICAYTSGMLSSETFQAECRGFNPMPLHQSAIHNIALHAKDVKEAEQIAKGIKHTALKGKVSVAPHHGDGIIGETLILDPAKGQKASNITEALKKAALQFIAKPDASTPKPIEIIPIRVEFVSPDLAERLKVVTKRIIEIAATRGDFNTKLLAVMQLTEEFTTPEERVQIKDFVMALDTWLRGKLKAYLDGLCASYSEGSVEKTLCHNFHHFLQKCKAMVNIEFIESLTTKYREDCGSQRSQFGETFWLENKCHVPVSCYWAEGEHRTRTPDVTGRMLYKHRRNIPPQGWVRTPRGPFERGRYHRPVCEFGPLRIEQKDLPYPDIQVSSYYSGGKRIKNITL